MEALRLALAEPGLPWLSVVIALAGIVRGFTGFGTALIYAPVAGIFLAPAEMILTLTVTGIGSAIVLVPRAWNEGERGDIAVLVFGAALTLPLGIAALIWLDRDLVRWGVSAVAALTLAALVSGWRYRGRVKLPGLLGIGSASGVIGGTTGLTGPPVILFYLGSAERTAPVVRANTILFLVAVDAVMMANFAARDLLSAPMLILGVLLTLPYMVGTWLGARLFRPALERTYRRVAYGVIGAAILTGLPVSG